MKPQQHRCGGQLPRESTTIRRTAPREAESRRALEHEQLFDVLASLEAMGEVMWRTDELCRCQEPEDLERSDLAELEPLPCELDDCLEELNDAVRALRRRVRGASKRVLRLVEEAEELLEDDEHDEAAEATDLHTPT